MTEEQIKQDRQSRVEKAKGEIEIILKKYELDITAEDMIGEHTRLKVMVQFVDTKKYDTPLAQPYNPIISPVTSSKDIMDDLLNPKGDKIRKK